MIVYVYFPSFAGLSINVQFPFSSGVIDEVVPLREIVKDNNSFVSTIVPLITTFLKSAAEPEAFVREFTYSGAVAVITGDAISTWNSCFALSLTFPAPSTAYI